MRIVISLGASALLDSGERPEAYIQRRHVRRAVAAIAPLAGEHQLVICPANGPQLGMLTVENEDDDRVTFPYSLDVLNAQTQGMIGYWITHELRQLDRRMPVACVLTQTVVSPDDPAFAAPTAFVGPSYTREQVQLWAGQLGWQYGADGSTWRRVVPALTPVAVVEVDAIRALLDRGGHVVCGGGGGVVVSDSPFARDGTNAVVDADRTAALLARALDADALLMLTDVDSVKSDFGEPTESAVYEIAAGDIAALALPPDSMGAKVDAAGRFAAATGRLAAIGALADAQSVFAGTAGTRVTGDVRP